MIFFFSSRRRHTRFDCDWSSDVCSSDLLLFQAARAQLYRELVLPSLEAQKVVLMDRTRDSSVIYQGIVRGFGVDTIEKLNNISTKNTYPNLTFLLDVPVEIGLVRRSQTEKMDR